MSDEHVVVDFDGTSGIERPTGVQQAVLSNVVDLGERDDKFKPGKKKHQVILIWQLAETYEFEGKTLPFQQTEFVTLTLNEKSKLRRFIEGMLATTVDELHAKVKAKGGTRLKLDLNALIGRNCMLTLVKKDAKPGEDAFTSVESCAPLMKNLPTIKPQALPVPQWVTDFVNGGKTEDASEAAAPDLGDVISAIS